MEEVIVIEILVTGPREQHVISLLETLSRKEKPLEFFLPFLTIMCNFITSSTSFTKLGAEEVYEIVVLKL